MKALTAAQRAQLQAELLQRRQALDARLAEHHGGLTRAEHAHELLEQDNDDVPQREGERGLDLAMSDRDVAELGAVSLALKRLHDGEYGRCADCDGHIPFARLQAEPWALRCVACESQREVAAARRGG